MQETPLFHEHSKANARMAPFAGWAMPIQYQGILAEHKQTREAASVFDICHMGEFELTGPGAEADLERLLTQRVSTIKEGQCRYGFLLNEQGGVLDDLTCYRLGPERFMLVVNAGTCASDAAWIEARLSGNTVFKDLSPSLAKLDVQGPASKAMLEKALGVTAPALGYFRCAEWDMAGVSCLLSRTGYTGEWGYELYFPAEHAVAVWRALLEGGIPPAGLGARDTLRLEVGYPLYGHEWSEDRTPVAAVGKQFMDLNKSFIGHEAVARELDTPPPDKLVGLQLVGKQAARAGDQIYVGDRKVGVVTSGSLAPSLGVAVALAYVHREHAEPGCGVELDVRGRRLSADVVSLPFYKHGTARG